MPVPRYASFGRFLLDANGAWAKSDRQKYRLSIDEPERLLFMQPANLKKIPGVGKASVDEIMRYRAKFIRSSVMKKNP